MFSRAIFFADSNPVVPSPQPKKNDSLVFNASRVLRDLLRSLPSGGKLLYVDGECQAMISLIMSYSELIGYHFYSVEDLTVFPTTTSLAVSAVVLCRPTSENIARICQSLTTGKHFRDVTLIFTNTITQSAIDKLARADSDHSSVVKIMELYLDACVLHPFLFSSELPSVCRLMATEQTCWTPFEDLVFTRMLDGLLSVVLQAGRIQSHLSKPGQRQLIPTVRVSGSSEIATTLGVNLLARLRTDVWVDSVKDPKQDKPGSLEMSQNSFVLILDRRDDFCQPLLTPWTYSAMLHEHLGISLNKVKGGGENPEEEMSLNDDEFYRDHMNLTFGEVAQSINLEVQRKNREQTQEVQNPASLKQIDKLKKLIDSYPDQKRQANMIAKHVRLVHTLSKAVEQSKLYEVSQAEQKVVTPNTIAANLGQQSVVNVVKGILDQSTIPIYDKYRLVLLFALKHPEQEGALRGFLESVDGPQVDKVQKFVRSIVPAEEKMSATIVDRAKNAFVRSMGNAGLGRAPSLIGQLLSNKLRLDPTVFPEVGGSGSPTSSVEKEGFVVIYVVGGVTYEEAREVDAFNSQFGTRIYLGATSIINSKTLLADVSQL